MPTTTGPRRILLNGQWVEGGAVMTIVSPWTGEPAGEVFETTPDQARQAGDAARAAMPAMRAMTGAQRSDALRKIAAGILQRSEELAAVMRDEVAKPMGLCRAEVQRAAKIFLLGAEETLRLPGECVYPDQEPQGAGMVGRVQSFPVGPVLGITPFNFPLNLAAHKVSPALAAACPIVIKPPPQGPSAALMLGEIVLESGFPPSGLQVLPGGLATGQALCLSDAFAVVSFTGSAKAGWAIKRNALPRQKVFLELGGNAAVIVDESADLELAAKAISLGAYAYAGQVCISTQRILIHESKIKVFTQQLAERINSDVGVATQPGDEKALVGPVIDRNAADRIEKWTKSAQARGAGAIVKGERMGERLIRPSLWEKVPEDEPLWSEEVFGPIAAVQGASDFRAAIAKANASRYGLQASVFTNSLKNAELAFRELECGAVLINIPTAFRIDAVPYGGVKESGLGREGVREMVREFCEPKLMIVRP